MHPAAARFFLIGALGLVFFVDRDRDALAANLVRRRHYRVGRLRKRRMIIIRGYGFRLAHVGYVDNAEAAMPAARPHFVAKSQRMMQPVPLTGPARLFAGGDILPRYPPT